MSRETMKRTVVVVELFHADGSQLPTNREGQKKNGRPHRVRGDYPMTAGSSSSATGAGVARNRAARRIRPSFLGWIQRYLTIGLAAGAVRG
jgi:hypothetical protein